MVRDKVIKEKAFNLLERCGVYSIPIDIDMLARCLGIQIVPQQLEEATSGILVIRNDQAAIGVNKDHHYHRQRFTIAHELGHYLLHSKSSNVFVDTTLTFYRDKRSSDGTHTQEVEANIFAAELLMPEGLLLQYLESEKIDLEDKDVLKLTASKFAVSVQALTLRLVNLGLIMPYAQETATQ